MLSIVHPLSPPSSPCTLQGDLPWTTSKPSLVLRGMEVGELLLAWRHLTGLPCRSRGGCKFYSDRPANLTLGARLLSTLQGGRRFGSSLACGDFNGDGQADLAVSAGLALGHCA